MLIPGKSHSRVESRNSRVSIETLDFARVRTFYQRDRCGMASGGARGAIAGWSLTLFPADVGTQSIDLIDIASGGAPEMSQNGRRGEVRLGKCSGRSASGQWAGESSPAPVGCRWTVGRRRGQIGAQNGGQWPCLRRHGARVETQAGNAVGGGRDCRLAPGRRVWEIHRPAVRCGWTIVSYRGRLKRPHLHCRADAVA